MRWFNRRKRINLSMLVLAVVAGLLVAVWSGPASAEDRGKILAIKTDSEWHGAPNGHMIKICIPYLEHPNVCTRWEWYASYEFETRYYNRAHPFGEYRWKGRIIICIDGAALPVDVPTEEQQNNDWLLVDLTVLNWRQEVPSLECL